MADEAIVVTHFPMLAVAPPELTLGAGNDSAPAKRRIAVVDRSNGAIGPVAVDSYDATLLEIERVGNGPVWEVAARDTSARPCVTKVRFRAGESTAELVVRWAGAIAPAVQGAVAPTD